MKLKRSIVIFPQFGSDINLIHDIRNQYDPLASKIAPHITLVFPFESEILSNTLRQHIETTLSGLETFTTEIILDDLSSEIEFEITLK